MRGTGLEKFEKRITKEESWDTNEIRIVAKYMTQIDDGIVPDRKTLHEVRDLFQRLINDESPSSIFGKKRGRPSDSGIDLNIVISAYIELEIRSDPIQYGRVGRAQSRAINAFEINDGPEGEFCGSARKQVERFWKNGKATAKGLTSEDLKIILERHRITSQDTHRN
jgi:hypothetical protein